MQRSFKLATQAGEPSLDYWGFAVHTQWPLSWSSSSYSHFPLWKYFYQLRYLGRYDIGFSAAPERRWRLAPFHRGMSGIEVTMPGWRPERCLEVSLNSPVAASAAGRMALHPLNPEKASIARTGSGRLRAGSGAISTKMRHRG